MFLSHLIGWTTFGLNIGQNWMHWLFSVKYWVIAHEVPKLFEESDVSFNEKLYKLVTLVGLLVNFIPCAMIGIARGKLTYDTGEGLPTGTTLNWVEGTYHACTALMLFSAVVLIDALRRISVSLDKNPLVQINTRVMYMHITMLTIHVIAWLAAEFFVFRAISDPSTTNKILQSISRIVLFTSQTIVQAILIYVFLSVNNTGVERSLMHPNRTSSEIDGSMYSKKNGNLKMIRYVKNNWESPRNLG